MEQLGHFWQCSKALDDFLKILNIYLLYICVCVRIYMYVFVEVWGHLQVFILFPPWGFWRLNSGAPLPAKLSSWPQPWFWTHSTLCTGYAITPWNTSGPCRDTLAQTWGYHVLWNAGLFFFNCLCKAVCAYRNMVVYLQKIRTFNISFLLFLLSIKGAFM